MESDPKELLEMLKFELHFLENGGYERSVREPRKELSVFQDSISCLNYALPAKKHPCTECHLMEFVPEGKQGESVPCHHIPLNERGDSVSSLGGPGDAPEVQEAVVDWLRRTIQQLEGAPAKSKQSAA